MAQCIGLLLVLFGLASLGVTLFVFVWLQRQQGPLSKLRWILQSFAGKLHSGSVLASVILNLATRSIPILNSLDTGLGTLGKSVEGPAGEFCLSADRVRDIKAGLDGITLKFPDQPTQSKVELHFSMSKIDLLNHTVYVPLLPGVPSDSIDLGPVNVVADLNWIDKQPLSVLDPAFDLVADRIDAAYQKMCKAAEDVTELKTIALDTHKLLDELIEKVLKPLPGKLEELSRWMLELSNNPLLAYLPLLILLFLGSIQFALLLGGIALLFI